MQNLYEQQNFIDFYIVEIIAIFISILGFIT